MHQAHDAPCVETQVHVSRIRSAMRRVVTSMHKVFRGSDALRRGDLTRYQLRTEYRPVFPDVYISRWTPRSLRIRTEAAWLWSGGHGVVAGLAASALLGADWVDDDEPVELIWRNTRVPVGIVVRNQRIGTDECTRVAGLPVTTPARTAYDLARQLPRDAAVARLDALARARRFAVDDVRLLVERYPGARGVRRLSAALPLVDSGAASPKETWLRLLVIDHGLPAPTTQIPIHQNWHLRALLDMGWEDFRVALEYDGDHHRTDRRQYARDQRRLRMLEALGWIVIRVIAGDDPEEVVRRVRAALHRRGYRDTCTRQRTRRVQ